MWLTFNVKKMGNNIIECSNSEFQVLVIKQPFEIKDTPPIFPPKRQKKL